MNSELKGSLGVGLAGISANVGGKRQTGQVQASQVLRKAIIQTSFKELYDIERPALALRPANPEHPPAVDSPRSLEALLGSPEQVLGC